MKMPPASSKTLRDFVGAVASGRFLRAPHASVALADLASGSGLTSAPAALESRSILVATADQLTTALALIALDGVARRLVLCPPGLPDEQLSEIIATAQLDAVVSDPHGPPAAARGLPLHVICSPTIVPGEMTVNRGHRTEWIMLTSGTTGTPKMAVHTLASLTGAIKVDPDRKEPTVWGTFYDIRRYGGLQIFLRAIVGGTSFVLSGADEPMAAHLKRLGAHGVTHLTGTPSHWRWALVNPSARAVSPHYVRLSGEIADQAILDNLRAFFPDAKIGHAYASTEAGVGFEVNDGLEGFPATLIGQGTGGVDIKVVDGELRIRSRRTAVTYLGHGGPALRDADGFVDTGDIVELRGSRYYFVGRRGGIINVGGLKVHPEEIEAVINRHPDVRVSLVRARKNPITGAIVVADVVLRAQADSGKDRGAELKREILEACRNSLPQHKVPASIRFVPSLDVSATGKMVRQYA
jgi:acyl-coenzyme A synthetase/AMP-(fatty) acid ligase